MMKRIPKLVGLILIIMTAWVGLGQAETSEIYNKITGLEKLKNKIDYSQKENWLSLPSLPNRPVDVLYFYPTTYRKGDSDQHIAEITDRVMRDGAKVMLKTQASVFAETCNIYAPYYRQIDAFGFNELTLKQQDMAAEIIVEADPFRWLDYYFTHYNNGRPFFLAGHSQGSIVLTVVLAEYFKKHPEHYKRMIGAYVIGFAVTKEYLADNPHLKFATKADDIGVIISYNTEAPENIGKRNLVVRKNSLAINPINWVRDETPATLKENLGSFDTVAEKLGPPLADATINLERGTVICSTADISKYASKAVEMFGPASFHAMDYEFYHENLRKNVQERIKAYNDAK